MACRCRCQETSCVIRVANNRRMCMSVGWGGGVGGGGCDVVVHWWAYWSDAVPAFTEPIID